MVLEEVIVRKIIHKLTLVFITPIFILFSHYIAVFLHEYAHAFTAWLLGYKDSPFALNYGGTSVLNILFLINIDQNVNNQLIYAAGHPGYVALIAFAGPATNVLLFFISLWLLGLRKIKDKTYLFYFLFFFCLMNLGNIYDYVPIRTFVSYGNMVDIVDIEQGWGISPWWVYILVGYPVIFSIWYFFRNLLTQTYFTLTLQSTSAKAALMIICVCILFGYFALPGLLLHQGISKFVGATSLIAIPGIVLALWPAREWVKRRLMVLENS